MATSTAPDEHGMVPDRRQAVTKPVPSSRVVSRPVPQAQTQNPREYQLGQMRRRFNPKETRPSASEFLGIEEGTTLLTFKLKPSDPDFPFEMTALECLLYVPPGYPATRPTLRVGNTDIPRGFAINIENGFDGLAKDNVNTTLLDLTKALDKNLEAFLSAQKAETVKLVPNKEIRPISLPSRPLDVASKAKDGQPSPKSQGESEVFTDVQKSEASLRREAEIRQLEARMGRLPLYKKSGDGIAYTIPLEPRKRSELPTSTQTIKTVQLFVPLFYPLQTCRIQVESVKPEGAKAVEKGFEKRAQELKEMTLMNHINYLAQNMHILAKTVLEPEKKPIAQPMVAEPQQPSSRSKGKAIEVQEDQKKSHVQQMDRPPEWTVVNAEDAERSESDEDYSYDSGDESSDDGGVKVEQEAEQQGEQAPSQNPERGTAISFPFIELYCIELLEVVTLNVTVKCERCKEVMEVNGLKNGISKSESCKKCATAFSIQYRRDLVHANGVRAGFLDLEGCTVVDMLPSTFIPTCSQCSTSYPLPGITFIRGDSTSNICRECHQKFTFKIPQIKFLRISSSDRLPPPGPRRKKKETLGLIPGTELPKRGRCRHYTKSYRWFRFSCCQKVYACDKCHDETEEHVNEWANRMICGWCSREGSYRPQDCALCHGVLVGRKGGGFWEGGKGTRDRVRMSRKDPRKFRKKL